MSLPSITINDVTVSEGSTSTATVSGTLNPGNETITYRIDGHAGQTLHFHNDSASSTAAAWYLYAPDNHTVAATGITADFDVTLPADGFYNLAIAGNASTSLSYSFDVSDTTEAPVTPTGFGVVQSGTLAPSGSVGSTATYTFTGSAGQAIYFDSQLPYSAYYAIDGILTGPSNSTVFNQFLYQDAGPLVLPHSGNYTLTLNSNVTTSQAYQFDMLALPANAPSLALNTIVSGTLNPANSAAIYSFAGAPGERLIYDGQGALNNSTYATLVEPGGSQTNLINSSIANTDSSPVTLTVPGTYYLVIHGESGAATPVPYQFQLMDMVGPAPTLTLNPDQLITVSGTLNPANAMNTYQFSGTAGEVISFHSVSDSIAYGSSVNLWGLNNQSLTSFYPYAGSPTVTLPATGDYLLTVAGSNSTATSDTYSFTVVQNTTPTDSLTLGATVTGSISNVGDTHTYTFQGTTGQHLYLDGLGATSTGSFFYQVFDPTGTRTNYGYTNNGSGGDFFAGNPVLPLTGTYRLVVTDQGYSGGYSFRLLDQASAPP